MRVRKRWRESTHTGKVRWYCFRIEFVNIGAPWSLFKHQGPAGTLRVLVILAHLHSSGNSVTRQFVVEDIRCCAILAKDPLISQQLWKRVRKTYLGDGNEIRQGQGLQARVSPSLLFIAGPNKRTLTQLNSQDRCPARQWLLRNSRGKW